MSINEVSQKEKNLILQAQQSVCEDELRILSKSSFSNVRRCVAKNKNTSKDVIDYLAYDPVINVNYVALQNQICSVKRELPISILNRCVTCPKNEATYYYECKNCTCVNSLI